MPTADATADNRVIIVDHRDRELGVEEKLHAHRTGILHRAVSVLAFTDSGALLLQRRSRVKYHSGGLWSNTACTHPRLGESPLLAAERCLRHEMGVVAPLRPVVSFMYRAQVAPGLVEHEFDHVFVARGVGVPSPNLDEVDAWRQVLPEDLAREMREGAHRFTAWFPIALHLVEEAGRDGRYGGNELPDRTWIVQAGVEASGPD